MEMIKRFYSNLSGYIDHNPFLGRLLLVNLTGGLIVMAYKFAYQCGRFFAKIT